MRRLFFAAAAVLLAGCERPPTLTAVPFVPHPTRAELVSVCFDGGNHGREEIETVAREGCADPASQLVPWQADRIFNECPLMKKRRVTFVCVPPAAVPERF